MEQRKVLLYVHDGSGLGHLRRISRIAESLQGPCAALIVTGHRDALWMVQKECEFVHIPNWDRLVPGKAAFWNRQPWLKLDRKAAAKFKSDFFLHIVKAFEPDAIFVDYLPLGKANELEEGLRFSPAKKYLVNRGVVDASDYTYLFGEALKRYSDLFHRIFIAADEIVASQYVMGKYDSVTSKKIKYVGYVMPESKNKIGVPFPHDFPQANPWVVCSAGGGKNGESFLEYCVEVGKRMQHVNFDVVFGPKTKKRVDHFAKTNANIRVHQSCHTLEYLNASCDVAIINGGYNSLMEAISGGARIIVRPNQSGEDDEQIKNVLSLSPYYPIELLEDITMLEDMLNDILSKTSDQRPSFNLKRNGAEMIKETILSDLGIKASK